MFCEGGIGEGIVAVDEFGEGTVLADEVGEELDAFVIHRAAEFGGEGGEAIGVWIDLVDHFVEFEPASGEVAREVGELRARDHAEGLCAENCGVAEFALIGELEEFAVGHGRPEEVGEAGRDFKTAEGPFFFVGFVVFGAEEKAGIDEEGGEGCAEGLLEVFARLLGLGEGVEEGSEVLFTDAAAVGEGGVVGEDFFGGGGGIVFGIRCREDDFAFEGGIGVDSGDDFLGSGEVFLEEGWRGEEGIGHVVEAFAAGAIDREVFGGVEGDAEEISDGVVVFVTVEAAEGDATGSLRDIAGFDAVNDLRERFDEGLALGISGEDILVIGGHFCVLDLVDDILEEMVFLESVIERVDIVQGDATFLFVGAVAGDAVLLEDGLDLVREVIGQGRGDGGEENQEGGEASHFGQIRGGRGGCIMGCGWREVC